MATAATIPGRFSQQSVAIYFSFILRSMQLVEIGAVAPCARGRIRGRHNGASKARRQSVRSIAIDGFRMHGNANSGLDVPLDRRLLGAAARFAPGHLQCLPIGCRTFIDHSEREPSTKIDE